MSRRRSNTFGDVNYQRIDLGFVDAQFRSNDKQQKIPWKAITLAVLLFCGGVTMLTIGSLIVSGHISTKYSDRMWPLIIIGMIMFIPGAYHMRTAFYAYKEYPGYSFDDIPEFE